MLTMFTIKQGSLCVQWDAYDKGWYKIPSLFINMRILHVQKSKIWLGHQSPCNIHDTDKSDV